MYSDGVWLQSVYMIVVFVWLGILTFLNWQQRNFLRSLFPKDGRRDIRIKFEEVLKAIEEFKTSLRKQESALGQLERSGLQHISRMELLRYNPYEDTGGDQSFTVALLDEGGSGVILTSLHARSQTRFFAKSITEGKSDKHSLSKEEEEVLEKALRQ